MKTKQQTAILIGGSLWFMALAAGLSYGMVLNPLLTQDLGQTAQDLTTQVPLFSLGLMGWVVIILADALVSLGLYKLYKDFDHPLALWTSLLRGIYTLILGLAVSQLFGLLFWIQDKSPADLALALDKNNLLVNFESIWSMGLIIFGLHLSFLAYMLGKHKLSPSWIVSLLHLAGPSYILSEVLPTGPLTSFIMNLLILPMTLAELAYASSLFFTPKKGFI